MTFGNSSDKPQLPAVGQSPTPLPLFGSDPGTAKKPKAKSMQPTFLGNGTAPTPGQLGNKTLLGQ